MLRGAAGSFLDGGGDSEFEFSVRGWQAMPTLQQSPKASLEPSVNTAKRFCKPRSCSPEARSRTRTPMWQKRGAGRGACAGAELRCAGPQRHRLNATVKEISVSDARWIVARL